jgi:hypothetical protein
MNRRLGSWAKENRAVVCCTQSDLSNLSSWKLDDTERFAALNMLLAYDIIGRGGGEETFEYNLSLVARALRDYFGMHLSGDGTLHSSQQQ